MYPDVTKEMSSAPPIYTETVNNTQQQAPPPVQSQVIVVQSGIPPLGSRSVQLKCPNCKIDVKSRVEVKSSTSAYFCCVLLCIIGCALCSCVPFCMDNFNVYMHSCPNCKAFLGTFPQS